MAVLAVGFLPIQGVEVCPKSLLPCVNATILCSAALPALPEAFSDPDLLFDSQVVSLVDVKSQRSDRKAQPLNNISAQKIARTAKMVLESNAAPAFEILYLGVKFSLISLADRWRCHIYMPILYFCEHRYLHLHIVRRCYLANLPY